MSSTNGTGSRLADPRAPRRPTSAIPNAIMALLQNEARPLSMNQIVRAVAAKFDGSKTHAIYNATYRLAERGAIDTIDRDGKNYYAHHRVASTDDIPLSGRRAGRAAILAALAEQPDPVPLRSIVDRVIAEFGVRDKSIYETIKRLTNEGLIRQEERDGRRYIALAPNAPEPPPALQSETIAALQSQHRPAAQPAGAEHVPALHATTRKPRPAPFDPAVAYAPEPEPEPPALPDAPHFLDCVLTIAGVDIQARVTIDLPNSIAREATFRYLVRVIRHLERISGDLLGIGSMAEQLAQALQLAEEEETKRKRLEERIGVLRAALAPDQPE